MSVKNIVTIGILYTLLGLHTASLSYAATIPSFPACTNPQGTLKVKYDSGKHGIAGNTSEFSGSDAVYQLTPETVTQCFCPEQGEGIQTNWWKVATLTESEINSLKAQGWTFIPDGSLWGLDKAPYLAINTSYSCNSTGGQVQSASTTVADRVLGLADSGNLRIMYGFLGLGLITLLTGIFLSDYSTTAPKSSKKRTYGRR